MAELEGFKIKLESPNAVYQAGDVISGDLIVKLSEPMKARGIKISFKGKAKVHWTEEEQRQNEEGETETYTVHYKGDQQLFQHSIYVFGQDSEDHEDSIPEGEQVFPFSYELPSRLPSSYEDSIGRIRYRIKATIDKQGKDNRTKKVVTVLDTLDLNEIPDAEKPAKGKESKYLCCLWCKNGPISAEFQTDRSAYVPGEIVTIDATLKNKSSSKVKETSVSLLQKISYHATGKSKIRYVSIKKVTGEDCPKGKTIYWTNEKLQIPPLPPTETTLCGVLKIEYFLMFQGHLRMCAVDLREYEEIIIGTVPIRTLEMYQNLASQQVGSSDDTDQVLSPSAVVDEPQQEFASPPAVMRPIYKAGTGEAVNLAAKDDDDLTMDDKLYSPQYTFYDWSQTNAEY